MRRPGGHPAPGRLLEREREVASFASLLDAASAGDSRIVLVEGAAGIGTSRLLTEARARAADASLPVLVARASELEREFPFGVVRQLFDAAALGDVSSATLHGLYWLTLNLADDRPLVLVVDDLH
jgi:predicted ATPase